MTKSIEKVISEFRENNRGLTNLDYFCDFLLTTLKKQREELVEFIRNMPIETVGNSAKTVDQIIALINQQDEKDK